MFNADSDPAFFLIADLDPGFGWPKIRKNLHLKQNLCFFLTKNWNFIIPLPPKGSPCYRRSLQPLKENIQHFKTWNFFFNFVLFLWVLLLSCIWIWIQQLKFIRIRNPTANSSYTGSSGILTQCLFPRWNCWCGSFASCLLPRCPRNMTQWLFLRWSCWCGSFASCLLLRCPLEYTVAVS